MIAVVPVRSGVLPLGAAETVGEAGGRVLLAGSGCEIALAQLGNLATEAHLWETDPPAMATWSGALCPVLAGEDVVLLPASPDGRDLAPRLAVVLGRPLLAPAVSCTTDTVQVVRGGGRQLVEHHLLGPAVVTLQPGVRGVVTPTGPAPIPVTLSLQASGDDAQWLETQEAVPGTLELAEAPRVVAAGNGLSGPEDVVLLGRVAAALGATPGATRVVTDAGWAPVSQQIGTTGVVIDPDLYIAVGISGAVQHVSGLGQPSTVISVNVDASCPMMAMADLALVTDGPGFLKSLAEKLGVADDGA